MSDNKNAKKELNDDELEKVNGSIKIVVEDDNPEELSFWEKIVKILFKN